MSNARQISGQWEIAVFDDPVPGDLIIDDLTKSIKLHFSARLTRTKEKQNYLDDIRQNTLYGKSVYGMTLVLIDCVIRFKCFRYEGDYIIKEGDIEAMYALEGKGIDRDSTLEYGRAEINFGEIGQWARICNFECKKVGTSSETCYQYKWNNLDSTNLPLSDNKFVCFSAGVKFPVSVAWGSELTLQQNIKVVILYLQPTPFLEVTKDIRRIREIISLATGKRIGAIDVSLSIDFPRPTDKPTVLNEDTNTCKVHIGDHIVPDDDMPDLMDCLFTLPELVSIAKKTRQWQDLFDKFQPSIELYLSPLIFDEKIMRVKFLTLMQAIELLHAIEFGNCPNTIVSGLTERVEANDDDAEDLLFFLFGSSRKCSQNEPGLKLRLCDLLYKGRGWPIDFPGKMVFKEFVNKLKDSRNYYTHYNPKDKEKAFSEEELPQIIQFMDRIYRYHILKALGFSEQKASARMANNWLDLLRLSITPANKEEWNGQ